VHHLDEGARGAVAMWLLHGEPSWTCLHRNVIPRLVGAG
jgi:hypothetical protein